MVQLEFLAPKQGELFPLSFVSLIYWKWFKISPRSSISSAHLVPSKCSECRSRFPPSLGTEGMTKASEISSDSPTAGAGLLVQISTYKETWFYKFLYDDTSSRVSDKTADVTGVFTVSIIVRNLQVGANLDAFLHHRQVLMIRKSIYSLVSELQKFMPILIALK